MTTFLITGGNTGIGLAIALARDGGRVFTACRSAAAGEAALTRIKSESGSGDVRLLALDLASLARPFITQRMLGFWTWSGGDSLGLWIFR